MLHTVGTLELLHHEFISRRKINVPNRIQFYFARRKGALAAPIILKATVLRHRYSLDVLFSIVLRTIAASRPAAASCGRAHGLGFIQATSVSFFLPVYREKERDRSCFWRLEYISHCMACVQLFLVLKG